MILMSRAEVLRKCLIVFDALRRVASKGNAGLEAMPGAEESFQSDQQICFVLREMLQEMESTVRPVVDPHRYVELGDEKVTRIADWQREVMENGPDEEMRLR